MDKITGSKGYLMSDIPLFFPNIQRTNRTYREQIEHIVNKQCHRMSITHNLFIYHLLNYFGLILLHLYWQCTTFVKTTVSSLCFLRNLTRKSTQKVIEKSTPVPSKLFLGQNQRTSYEINQVIITSVTKVKLRNTTPKLEVSGNLYYKTLRKVKKEGRTRIPVTKSVS